MTPFERKVLTVVSRIPVGRVTTYGDIARLAGKPGAARAVGNIMRRGDRPGLPYHRVIAAGGGLGGYSNPAIEKVAAVGRGVTVTPRRVVGFARIHWPASADKRGPRGVAEATEIGPQRRKRQINTNHFAPWHVCHDSRDPWHSRHFWPRHLVNVHRDGPV